MKKIKVKTDLKGLNRFINSLDTTNSMYVKVGILKNKNIRKDQESNASIGLVHEFGSYSKNIPERSFLRMPIRHQVNQIVKEINRLKETMANGSVRSLFKKIGTVAEESIGLAFKTGGFGIWRDISPATQAKKNSPAILIETDQLQRSITSIVVKRGS